MPNGSSAELSDQLLDLINRVVAEADTAGVPIESPSFMQKCASMTGSVSLLGMTEQQMRDVLAELIRDPMAFQGEKIASTLPLQWPHFRGVLKSVDLSLVYPGIQGASDGFDVEVPKTSAPIERHYKPADILGRKFRPEMKRMWGGKGEEYRKLQVGEVEGTLNPADGDPVDALTFTVGKSGRITRVLSVSRKSNGNDKYLVEIDGIPAPKDWLKHWKACTAFGSNLDQGKVNGKAEEKRKSNFTTGEIHYVRKDLSIGRVMRNKDSHWNRMKTASPGLHRFLASDIRGAIKV